MKKSLHYCESLFVENRPKFAEIRTCKEGSQSNESLQIKELRRGIKVMKNGRSSRLGRIAPELIKCGRDYLDKYLLLINNCLGQNEIPKQWKESYMTSFYKKESKKNPGNYRKISINSTLSRLFVKIIYNKFQ